MRKIQIGLISVLCILCLSCSMNIAVDMISVQRYDNYELRWNNAFPINYFKYEPQTHLFLYSVEKLDSSFELLKIKINIPELNYSHEYSVNQDFTCEYGTNRVDIVLRNCFSEFIQDEEDLKLFKTINKIDVELELMGSEKISKLMFSFQPKLNSSSKLLDNLMSI